MGLLGAITSFVSSVIVGVVTGVVTAVAIGASVVVGAVAGAIVGAVGFGYECARCQNDIDKWNEILSNIKFDVPVTFPWMPSAEIENAVTYFNADGSSRSVVTVKVTLQINSKPFQSFSEILNNILTNVKNKFSFPDDTIIKEIMSGELSGSDSNSKFDFTTIKNNFVSLSITKNDFYANSLTVSVASTDPKSFTWSGKTEKDIVSSLLNTYMLPWSYTEGGLRVDILVLVRDAISGFVKGHSVVRIQLPAVRVTAQISTAPCRWTSCGKFSPFNWYFIPLDKIERTLTVTFDGIIRKNDVVEVYVGSPNIFYNLYVACCKLKSNSDVCNSDFVNKVCEGGVCQSGFITVPGLFEEYMKVIGYISPESVEVAKLLSDMGYPVKIQTVITDFKTEGTGTKVAINAIDPDTLNFGTFELDLSTGEKSSSLNYVTVTQISEPNGITRYNISLRAKNKAVISVPIVPAVSGNIQTFDGVQTSFLLDTFGIMGSDSISNAPVMFPGGVAYISRHPMYLFIMEIDDIYSTDLFAMLGKVKITAEPDGTFSVECTSDDCNTNTALQGGINYVNVVVTQIVENYKEGLINGFVFTAHPVLNKILSCIGEALRTQKEIECEI